MIAGILAGACSSQSRSNQAVIERGRGVYQQHCAACHGTDGKSPGAIPSIYRKSPAFISQALLDFREGRRPATVMGRHASGYSNEEIQMIADYFSSLP